MNREQQTPCPKCGTVPLADDARCWNCDYPVNVKAGDATPPATPEPPYVERPDYAELDPGIRDTVKRLNYNGWSTTDSGDGVSKPADWYAAGEAIPFPHVVIETTCDRMIADARAVAVLLGEGWTVEATYATHDDHVSLFARTLDPREASAAALDASAESSGGDYTAVSHPPEFDSWWRQFGVQLGQISREQLALASFGAGHACGQDFVRVASAQPPAASEPPNLMDVMPSWRATLLETQACAAAWEPDVRLLGNVKTGDIVAALAHVLSQPPAASDTPEYIQIAERLCRDAGCRCPKPLLGWTEQHTPRCRLCNTDAVPAASGDVERLITEMHAAQSTMPDGGLKQMVREWRDTLRKLAGDHSTPGGTNGRAAACRENAEAVARLLTSEDH